MSHFQTNETQQTQPNTIKKSKIHPKYHQKRIVCLSDSYELKLTLYLHWNNLWHEKYIDFDTNQIITDW